MINVLTESNLKDDHIAGIANTLTKARNGLTITKDAVKDSVGSKIPILLNHNWDSNPVGEANIDDITDEGLHFTGDLFKSVDHRDLLMEGIRAGVQSVSVGIRVLDHDGPKITKAELLELSLTPVPADAGAKVEAFKLNDNQQQQNDDKQQQQQPKQQSSADLNAVVTAINNLTSAVKSLNTNNNNNNTTKQQPDNNSDQLKEALSNTLSVYGNTFSYHDYRNIKHLLNESEGEK